jgi:RecA-family ATPase
MQISGGSFIFGREIKNCNVLYLDKENPKFTFKNRFKGLQSGTNIKTKNKLFTYMNGDILDDIFILSLKQTIKERKIGLLVFDTLHRFGSYNEDKADDLIMVYTKVFQPLIQMGVTIIFLHHTTKKNKEDLRSMNKKGYRGSSDLEGMCDTVLKIERRFSEGKKENKFKLVQEKNRHGKEQEPINIELVIDSEDDDTIISANFREYTPVLKTQSQELLTMSVLASFTEVGDILNSNEIKELINLPGHQESAFKRTIARLEFDGCIKLYKTEGRLKYYKLLKKTIEIE